MINLPYQKRFIITQIFMNPSSRYSSGYHLGVDLVGLENKNIYAIQDGTVIVAEYNSAFGNTVVVRQIDGLYCRYSHLDRVDVINNQDIDSGKTLIGIEGKTGNVIGDGDPRHLDLRISRIPSHSDSLELYRNPCNYLGIPNKLNTVINSEGEKMTKISHVIICKSEIDKRAAAYLADHLNCKIIEPDLLPVSVLDEVFETIYVIGSSEKPLSRAINIYGKDRYETCQKVFNLIL